MRPLRNFQGSGIEQVVVPHLSSLRGTFLLRNVLFKTSFLRLSGGCCYVTDELWCFFLFLVAAFDYDALATRRRTEFFFHCFPEVLQNVTVGQLSRRNLFFTWPLYVAFGHCHGDLLFVRVETEVCNAF